MAISDTQKVDYLFKKLGFGLTKTDVPANKQAFNESIPSPLLVRGDKVWKNSDQIPAVMPVVSNDIVRIYSDSANTSATVECVEDITATDNRTWKTNLTDWVTTEFGSTYLVKVYVDAAGSLTPQTTGTQLLAAGSTNNDEWFFDYQSGVLHFIGDNLPASVATGVTGRSVFVSGARYVGEFGVTGNIKFNGTTISTNANLTLFPANGYIFVSNSIISNVADPINGQDAVNLNYLNNQISNIAGQITSTANVIYAGDTKVEIIDDNILPGKINFVVDGVLKANITANSANFYVNSVNVGLLTLGSDTITSSGNIILSPQNSGILRVTGSQAIRLPVGNDDTRPVNAEIGYARYNSERKAVEFYDGTKWETPGEYLVTSDVIEPDGVSNVYVLTSATTSDGVLVSINGTLQQPYVSYTVDGVNIVFSETPLITDIIEVRHIAAGGTSVSLSKLSSFESSSLVVLENSDVIITGNLIPSATASYDIGNTTVRWQNIYCGGNITTTGNVVAAKFYGDGSGLTGVASNFGNAQIAAYLPTYTGNIGNLTALNASGNITTTGNVVAAKFYGDGSALTGISSNFGNAQIASYLPTYAGNIGGTVTTAAQPNITSLGTLNLLSVTGNITAGNVSATRLTGTLTTASQTNITALGNIVTGTWSATPIQNAYLANSSLTINGTSVTLGSTATVTANAATLTGTALNSAVVTSSLTSVGNLASLSASGNINTTGNVVAAKFYGSGAGLTAIPNSALTNSSITINGSAVSLGGSVTIDTSASGLTGNTLNSNIVNSSLTSVGTLGSLSVTGNISGGNLTMAGYITTTGANGNISGVNNLSANTVVGTLTTSSQPNITLLGNLTALSASGNITTTGNVIAAKFYGDGSNLTGLPASYGNTQVAAYLPTYAGNIGGTISTSSQPNITSVGTLSSLSVTGNITAGNISATRLTGALTTASQTSITALGNIVTGTWSATPIQNSYLANSSLTINGTSVSLGGTATVTAAAGTLTGTTLNSTVVNSSLTSVGNLTALNVSGNITTAGNVVAAKFYGDGSALTGISSNFGNAQIASYLPTYAGNIGGTVTTAAQPKITSLGNLTALSASGNISTTGNVVAAKFYGDGSGLTGVASDFGNAQIAAYLPTYTGNVLAANVTAATVTANISTANITSINGGTIKIQTTGAGDIQLNPLGTGTIQLKGPVQYDPAFNFTTTNGNPIPIPVGLTTPSITATGTNGTLTLAGTGTGYISLNDDVTVTGNLTVNGITTSLNVTNLNVQDNIINISDGTTGTPTQNAGLLVVRGDEPNVQMRWNESVDRWQITNNGTTYANIIDTTLSDTTAFTGNVNTGGVLKTTGGFYNANPPIISANATITSAYLGGFLELSGSNPYTVTLPAPSLYTGAKITIWQNTSANITLATPSGLFYGPSGSVSNTKVLSQSVTSYWDLWSDSYNWILFGIKTV
jgi:hypothetical protein